MFRDKEPPVDQDNQPTGWLNRLSPLKRRVLTAGVGGVVLGGVVLGTSADDSGSGSGGTANTCILTPGISKADARITATGRIDCGAGVMIRTVNVKVELQHEPLNAIEQWAPVNTGSTNYAGQSAAAHKTCDVGEWRGVVFGEVTDDQGNTAYNDNAKSSVIVISKIEECYPGH